MKQDTFRAFSLYANNIRRHIISDVFITKPFQPGSISDNEFEILQKEKSLALWDTGATNSAITSKLAINLGLIPITFAKVQHADGESVQGVHLVNIFLPNQVAIPVVKVTECKSTHGNFDAIIGMDIITLGDFAFTNYDNKSLFTFRVPSYNEIDFVKEFNEMRKKQTKKTGRNELCPCGSGKKYKNCCMNKNIIY